MAALFRCFFSLLLDLVMMKSSGFLANNGEHIQATFPDPVVSFLNTAAWLFYPTKSAIELLNR